MIYNYISNLDINPNGSETQMGIKPNCLGEFDENHSIYVSQQVTNIRMCPVLLNGLATLSRTILSRKENNLKWLFLL